MIRTKEINGRVVPFTISFIMLAIELNIAIVMANGTRNVGRYGMAKKLSGIIVCAHNIRINDTMHVWYVDVYTRLK